MATKISSEEALTVLEEWKERHSSIRVFVLAGAPISLLMQTASVRSIQGDWVKVSSGTDTLDFGLRFAQFQLVDEVDVPSNVLAEMTTAFTRALRVSHDTAVLVLVETVPVSKPSESLH